MCCTSGLLGPGFSSENCTRMQHADGVDSQQTATARLLAQSLEGQRQVLMAKESQATEQGLNFSDSSEDEGSASAGQDENAPEVEIPEKEE